MLVHCVTTTLIIYVHISIRTTGLSTGRESTHRGIIVIWIRILTSLFIYLVLFSWNSIWYLVDVNKGPGWISNPQPCRVQLTSQSDVIHSLISNKNLINELHCIYSAHCRVGRGNLVLWHSVPTIKPTHNPVGFTVTLCAPALRLASINFKNTIFFFILNNNNILYIWNNNNTAIIYRKFEHVTNLLSFRGR